MSFKTQSVGSGKHRAEGTYELSRFCSKRGHVVNGGFSKLLKWFKNEYTPVEILSYSDNRYSNGDVYARNGFELSGSVPPRYYYLNPKTGKLEHRFKYAKFKLVEMGYDSILTEKEIMESLGFFRVWDFGKKVWSLG
jgi:hypothetical protein